MIEATLQADDPAGAEGGLLPFTDLGLTGREVETRDGRAVLVGTRCRACGRRSFPAREICLYCASSDIDDVEIGSNGILYSHTTVHVSGTRQTPYTIGYVDLPDDVRTLAFISDKSGSLRCDMPVTLVADADGWSFRPIERPGE